MKLVIQVVSDDDKETGRKFVVPNLAPFAAATMHQRLMDLVKAREITPWM